MTHLGYLIAGWGISLGVIAIYATSLIRRGKTISARVPVENRRWITSDE